MQQATPSKNTVKTARTGAVPAAPRKEVTTPGPLDPKALERVGGGLCVDLPNRYW